MSLTYTFLSVYSYMCDYFNFFYGHCERIYKDMEMRVLNNTITEVYFYDYFNNQKDVIRNNNQIHKVLFLTILKWFEYDVKQFIDNDFLLSESIHLPISGMYEIVYYSERTPKKYYTRGDKLDVPSILHHMNKKPPHSVLFATLSDKYNITQLINNHITSFHSKNPIRVIDIVNIMQINQKKSLKFDVKDECYIELIEDDTLSDKRFEKYSHILLMRDE